MKIVKMLDGGNEKRQFIKGGEDVDRISFIYGNLSEAITVIIKLFILVDDQIKTLKYYNELFLI